MSRKLRVAGVALCVALGSVFALGAVGGAAPHTTPRGRIRLETRAACGKVAPGRARCSAVQVLNPSALASKAVAHPAARASRRHPTTTTVPKTTTTVPKTTTTPAPTTTTSAPTTTTSAPTTTTSAPTTTTSAPTTTTSAPTTTTSAPTTTTGATTTTTAGTPPSCTAAHAGFTPCDLQSAYALPASPAGQGQTVAIVDAYNDPNAEADLGVYRAAYGLPACTTTNGCFRKVDEFGGTSYPNANVGWSEEISLDVDMVSAVCPSCHILLVEASSNGLGDLLTAENEAAALGASAISNSWAASEFSVESLYDSYFDHHIPITASSGDSGYGVSWPAASPYVTAVGGTSLTRAANARGWSETVWNGAGSGCSAFEPKPAWQTDTGCAGRTVADVSAVANPSTGVATYDTYGEPGWLVFGGTSVASPIVASVYALAGNGASISTPAYAYAHPAGLNDVTAGSNGSCGSYLCTGSAGYDGPTGLGTPFGTAAF